MANNEWKKLSESEWREKLPDDAYYVLREKVQKGLSPAST